MAEAPLRSAPARTKARKRALDVLFESDLRGVDPLETLASRTLEAEPPVRTFTADLVRGVHRHQLAIDQLLAECLQQDWTLERMPRVDRCLARIAVFEIGYTEVAPEVAISEAVTLADQLSTDESPAFLNGVLGKVLQRYRDRTV